MTRGHTRALAALAAVWLLGKHGVKGCFEACLGAAKDAIRFVVTGLYPRTDNHCHVISMPCGQLPASDTKALQCWAKPHTVFGSRLKGPKQVSRHICSERVMLLELRRGHKIVDSADGCA